MDSEMKKLLLQLDTDKHPSSFDRIVPYDAGVDEVLSYGSVTPADVRGLIYGAFFTRGVPDLKNTAVWIGGSDVLAGQELLAESQKAFFGPFKVSLMLDSNGCNTTAATAIAKLSCQSEGGLSGHKAVILGQGPVGLRAATLLAGEGCEVAVSALPEDVIGNRYDAALAARGMEAAQQAGLAVATPANQAALEELLQGATVLVAAGPAGVQLLRRGAWATLPTVKMLLDFNLTEPVGIEGVKPSDDMKEREGKLTLGPLAIGNPKMKVHKACLGKLFESNELVLDAEGVYAVAKEVLMSEA
jgi:hypothetical protein